MTRRDYLICLSLVVLTLAVYWQVAGFEFVNYDDDVYVYNNPVVKAGTMPVTVRWAFTTSHACLWQPLVWLSYMADSDIARIAGWVLDVEFGRGNAGIYHITNVVFHLLNTALLFLVLSRLTGRAWRSAFVAALFAIHPLHVESVAWVAERKDVLSGLFWVLTMWAYARYAESRDPRKYLILMLVFALGLMSKSMLVTLPPVLLLMDFWPLGRLRPKEGGPWRWRPLIIEKLPLVGLSALSSVITYFAMRSGGGLGSADLYPLGVRIANALVAYTTYIAKMVWPRGLAVVYPHPYDTLPVWQVVGSGLLLAAITVLAFRLAGRRPYVLFGWLWYVITLLPVSGIIQQGKQAVTDHFTYIPLTGLFIIIAWGIPGLLAGSGAVRSRRAVVSALGVLSVAALMVPAYVHVGYWRNSITLFTRAIEVTSDNSLAHNNLANALVENGEVREAIGHFHKALKFHPEYTDARYNLANALYQDGKVDEAIRQYTHVLREAPRHEKALNNLGIVYAQQGSLDEAIRCFSESLKTNPYNETTRENLENARVQRGW